MDMSSHLGYTQQMEDELWNTVGKDYEKEGNYDELLAYWTNKEVYKPFSERLLNFYNKTLQSDFDADQAPRDLLARAKCKEITLNRNTIKAWFCGQSEPQRTKEGKDILFKIVFVLELTCEQCEEFFHKVYYDKAFNKRNYKEFIYLYCIHNGYTYRSAEEMVFRINEGKKSEPDDKTMQSIYLDEYAREKINQQEVIDFVLNNSRNFAMSDVAARKRINDLKDEIMQKGLARMEFERRRSEFADVLDNAGTDGRDTESVDFMLYIIKGIDIGKNVKSVFEEKAIVGKEITTQFPDKHTFANEQASAYVLRKELILLFFYWYWVQVELFDFAEGDFDGFRAELNNELFQCGFAPLYIGNPYDTIFLYCAAAGNCDDGNNPLDIFRGIAAAHL